MSTAIAGERAEILGRLRSEVTLAIADGILFQQAVADRIGLSLGDFKCLTVLLEDGGATAGAIATRTGLTTGAVTRMIDRLERAGWVVRERDLHDRRRVTVRPVPHRAVDILPLMRGVESGWAAALADYPDEQIALLLDLFGKMRAIVREQAALVRRSRS